ncbi:MAG TPA: DUF1249 domain-containing protein [Spongiibacteraceae bacterium]|nr:DUF1249 domain-containing protein [Spongiibacteraceae bacterium]HUH36854.1 DUF1249 domain-containing protein [Spongiibacteraceae bacterium]
MTRPRYQVNLRDQHAECEANYARLAKLLRAWDDGDREEYGLPEGTLRLRITERSAYTSVVSVERSSRLGAPQMLVRVYHDARMAEVIACNRHRRAVPRYDYPNAAMHQPDEKRQWDRFLGECLSHCLTHGRSLALPVGAPD